MKAHIAVICVLAAGIAAGCTESDRGAGDRAPSSGQEQAKPNPGRSGKGDGTRELPSSASGGVSRDAERSGITTGNEGGMRGGSSGAHKNGIGAAPLKGDGSAGNDSGGSGR